METQALAPWQYSQNRTVLHRDPDLMPSNRRAWACWNVLRPAPGQTSQKVRVTYWMNRLQRLPAKDQWLVSLNPVQDCAPGTKMFETMYEHPVYTLESTAAQRLLPLISGRKNTYFCGSYHGYGFHEDGARSAVDVAHKHFGIST
jgi:predicted NAD/FAD-binding protein